MRDANGNRRSSLFRPTRDLQFSDAAVQAIRAAERRRTGQLNLSTLSEMPTWVKRAIVALGGFVILLILIVPKSLGL